MLESESLSNRVNTLISEVPDLANIAESLLSLLDKAQSTLDKVFSIALNVGKDIILEDSEQQEINNKVSKVIMDVNKPLEYARIVQLVFQLNYYVKTLEKAIKTNFLDDEQTHEVILLLEKLKDSLQLIESRYLR